MDLFNKFKKSYKDSITENVEVESHTLNKITNIPYEKIPYKANICIEVSVEFESIIDVPILIYIVRVYCNDTIIKNVIVHRMGDCCLKNDYANNLRKQHLHFAINLADYIASNLEGTINSKGLSLKKRLNLQIEVNNLESIEGYLVLYTY